MEPDYKALYFELAHAVGTVERMKRAAFDGQADGSAYWQAQGRLDTLVGAALCWEDDPAWYAAALARKSQQRQPCADCGYVHRPEPCYQTGYVETAE